MIDYGLAVSMIVAVAVPSMLVRVWPPGGFDDVKRVSFFDAAAVPAFVAMAVGRIVTLAIDDPSSIGSVSDMLIIRSGVEFWPGAMAAVLVAALAGRRDGNRPLDRVAGLAPLAMVGYASYEAACVVRDGCYGPAFAVGFQPAGTTTTMLPIGWLMAAAVVAAAVGVRRIGTHRTHGVLVVAYAGCAVAVVRSVGSIWLPHVGDGLTRQHQSSIIVGVVSGAALIVFGFVRRFGPRWSAKVRHGDDASRPPGH